MKKRKIRFPVRLVVWTAVLLAVVTGLYAYHWLIPILDMGSEDRQAQVTGLVEQVQTVFVTEPEWHRQKYTVLSLQDGPDLYIHESLAEADSMTSLKNTRVSAVYLRRYTFEENGHVLVSLRTAGEERITPEDTAQAFRQHVKDPILTAVITIAVMWGTYLLVLIFRRAQVFAKRRKKHRKKTVRCSKGRRLKKPGESI